MTEWVEHLQRGLVYVFLFFPKQTRACASVCNRIKTCLRILLHVPQRHRSGYRVTPAMHGVNDT